MEGLSPLYKIGMLLDLNEGPRPDLVVSTLVATIFCRVSSLLVHLSWWLEKESNSGDVKCKMDTWSN